MATVRHIGLLPNVCFPFREREQLKWRQTFLESDPIDLGVAPDSAYLKLTKEQATFIYWRVKEWEVSWGWASQSISRTFVFDFGGGAIQTSAHSFSYPEATYSEIFPANHLIGLDAGSLDEKDLVCNIWSGGVPRGAIEDTNLAISSTWTNTFSSGGEDENFDSSRDTIALNTIALGSEGFGAGIESGFEYDVAWISNQEGVKLYWPYAIDVGIRISEIGLNLDTNDGILFLEGIELPEGQTLSPEPLPVIAGNLTTHPRGESVGATETSFKVEIHLLNEDIIELPLFDITEPSPTTFTKFNVPGFTGVTIKPHSYWPYDPGDGGGPIYDSATGAQLRDRSTWPR